VNGPKRKTDADLLTGYYTAIVWHSFFPTIAQSVFIAELKSSFSHVWDVSTGLECGEDMALTGQSTVEAGLGSRFSI
jgi:hypothetical protein